MISVRLLLQVLFAFSWACLVCCIPTQFENSKVIRTIEIVGGIAREDVGIRAKNIDTVDALEYYFHVPTVISSSAASFNAFKRKEKTELKITFVKEDALTKMNVYKINLIEPVKPQQDVLLGLKVTYTHTIKPMPLKLPQVSRQHTVFAFNSYFLSPYKTIETKTTLQTPTKNIISHTGAGGKSAVNGNKVIYGPYENIAPLSFEIATCHFENSKALITISKLERDIEISHWGKNLAIEEHYAVTNDGARLEGDFSRVQYQLTSQIHDQTNVLKSFQFDLPVSSRDTYFRDEVGNVSTSHFRVEKNKANLEIIPRYPLFGGWNYTWYHGFNANLGDYVRKTKNGKYILNIKFVENIKDMTVDQAIVRVVLPEGAKNVKVNTPFDIDHQSIDTYFTYFDSTGRLMIELEKSNVVQEHELPIQIEYEYSSLYLLQKPIVTSAAILILFVISIGLNKIPFTIHGEKTKSSLKKE